MKSLNADLNSKKMKLLIFFYFFSMFSSLLMGVDYLSYKIVFFIQVLSLF